MIITNNGDVFIFDTNGTIIEKIYQYTFGDIGTMGIDPRSTTINKNGGYWIADDDYGLVKKNGSFYEKTSPDGPIDNSIFSMHFSGGNLWIAAGGRDASWTGVNNKALFQKNTSGSWSVFNNSTFSEMEGFHDIIAITVNPSDPEHVFASAWGGGVFEFQGNQFVKRHSIGNSSLQSAIEGEDHVRVGGMAFDQNGKLWFSNGGATNVLSSYKDGNWESYLIPDLKNGENLGGIVITDEGDKWIALWPRANGGDIYVVKGENEDQIKQNNIAYLSSSGGDYYFQMREVYCMAKDLEGAIWVGSSKGVAVYDDPSRIWNDPEIDPLAQYARQPGLDLGDDVYHPLLGNETVTAIAVDGANRKWCGTKKAGVFLISEDGEKELEHFTSDNSPLLSNEITSIAINNKNGEVFFGTSKGLISYMGEAVEPEDEFTDVYVYPNPVRENYEGQ